MNKWMIEWIKKFRWKEDSKPLTSHQKHMHFASLCSLSLLETRKAKQRVVNTYPTIYVTQCRKMPMAKENN